MLGLARTPTARKRAAADRHPLGVAAVVGALLGVALVVTLTVVPVLGWTLLATATNLALIDIACTAVGRPSPIPLERLLPRRPERRG